MTQVQAGPVSMTSGNDAIGETEDNTYDAAHRGHCKRCEAHLGHVFATDHSQQGCAIALILRQWPFEKDGD